MLNSYLVRNIAKLFTGSAIAQLLNIAFLPLLSRLFGPAVFGEYGAILALINVSVIALSLRMELSVVEDSLVKGVRATIAIMISSSAIVVPLLFYVSLEFYNLNYLESMAIPLISVGMVIYQLYVHAAISQTLYTKISWMNISKALTFCLFQILAFYLLGGELLAILVANIFSLVFVVLFYKGVLRPCFSSRGIEFKEAWVYIITKKETPIYAGSQGFLNTLSQSLPFLMLPLFFSAHSLGLYFFAEKVFRLPLILIGQPVRQAFFGFCSKEDDEGRIKNMLMLLSVLGGSLAICISLILFTHGNELFIIIFGGEYEGSGMISAWLAIWSVGAFMSFPAIAYLRARSCNKFIFFIELIFLPIKAGSLYVASTLSNEITTPIAIYSTISLLMGVGILIKAFCVNANLKSVIIK